MRLNLLGGIALLSVLSAHRLPAVDTPVSSSGFALPEIGQAVSSSRFSVAEISHVSDWIKREMPECPDKTLPVAAEGFLEELRRRYPDQADRLLAADFPTNAHLSMLLRHVGVNLNGAASAGLREKIALRRIASLSGSAESEAAGILAKIRESSQVQHRRVLEGRLEDDEMRSLMDKTRQPAGERKAVAAAKPAELTASDIVAEFARRNQTGAAVSRLQAYAIEGRLTDATGAVSELLLFKMRPDRFRLVVRSGGRTRSILAGDGEIFWAQIPGQPPRAVPPKAMGERRHLAEFIDPLLGGEGYAFERLADGAAEARPFHRISVKRPDGSSFVARIDAESFQEVGRENPDQSLVRYSDHREVAGITLAFQEVAEDATAGRSTFVISRITPNPGLISDFFQPPSANQPNYLDFEQIVAPTAAVPATPTSK